MKMYKIKEFCLNFVVLVCFPIVFIFLGVFLWLFLLISLPYEKENGKHTEQYFETKKLITPKNFILKIWEITKDMCNEGIQDTKQGWPILLGILVIGFLPLTISLIFG